MGASGPRTRSCGHFWSPRKLWSPLVVVLLGFAGLGVLPVAAAVSQEFVDAPVDDNHNNLVAFPCPPLQREFTAVTEMHLTGRRELLELAERKMLKGVFMNIYNDLTTTNCDSYHRKIHTVNFLRMRNTLNDTYTLEELVASNISLTTDESQLLDNWFNDNETQTNTTEEKKDNHHTSNHTTRRLQEEALAQNGTLAPESQPFDLSITYAVVGTCRDCPIGDAGAFELYDDSFRRLLRGVEGIRTRLLRIRDLKMTDAETANDCVCREGVEPQPQAPGVEECVNLMNEELPIVAEQTGLLRNLTLQTLLQLDDWSTGSDETTTTTFAPTAEETMESVATDEGTILEEKEALEEELAAEIEDDGVENTTLLEGDPTLISNTEAGEAGDRKPNAVPVTVARNENHPALQFNIWGR